MLVLGDAFGEPAWVPGVGVVLARSRFSKISPKYFSSEYSRRVPNDPSGLINSNLGSEPNLTGTWMVGKTDDSEFPLL